MRAYDEFIDFIAAGTKPAIVATFEPSQRTKNRVDVLIRKERTIGLTPDETAELELCMAVENLMRLAKARAKKFCQQ